MRNKRVTRKRIQLPIGLTASLLSIGIGLLCGLIVMFLFNASHAPYGFGRILFAGVSSMDKLAKVLYQAAPLIMTGLAVGFAFKTGLFNIGATGQYTIGAFCALACAIQFQLPWYVCLFAAMLGGMVWGFFPGFFKAAFNVNEVITSIMFNWIGLFLVNLSIANTEILLAKSWGLSQQAERTAPLAVANPSAIIPKIGLDKLFDSNYMNISIFIAVLFAMIIWVILSKTTFGYELKACGYNRNASTYAGINAKRSIVLSMLISGGLAGVGGGLYYLAGTGQYVLLKNLLAAGFNGIPVALLATSHPIGTVFSALFISYIQVGGEAMQPEFVKEIIDIIIAVIIYLAAFSLLMKEFIGKRRRKVQEAAELASATSADTSKESEEKDA